MPDLEHSYLDRLALSDAVIADSPPADGREWDCQCARCGSSTTREDCDQCGSSGYRGGDRSSDECCELCSGAGSWQSCLSSEAWCTAHPLPGREAIERGQIEWFVRAEVSGA